MLRWNERYQQWTVEKERHGERLFRRLSRDIGREQEGEARTMAAAILGEFREAQEAGGPGYLYVASHPAFPGMLKIGMTTAAPERRCQQLSGQLPSPCRLEFAVTVPQVRRAESAVHRRLASSRVDVRREWFRVDLIQARAAILLFLQTP
jgi:hypothetical protein